VPSWTIVGVILTYVSYSALAIRSTPAFNDMKSITGSVSFFLGFAMFLKLALPDSRVALPSQEDAASNPYFISSMGGSIPELYDIPIGVVNSILYRDALQRATSLNVEG
jgi:phosphatidylinositol glycan class P protein